MADFSRFLLVSDFDHTLTDHNGHIPQANLDAIEYFTSHGGVFTISTGRSLPASKYRFQDIPMNAPLLFCNGAGCYDRTQEELIFCRPLPADAMALILRCVEAFPDLRLEVHGLQCHYVFHADPHRDASLRRQQTPFIHVSAHDEIPTPWVKFSMYSRDGDVASIDPNSRRGQYFKDVTETVTRWAGPGYVVTLSMPGLIEVQVAGTSKGLAARELAKKLNRPVLVCAGDAPNDIPMLEEADLPFLASDGDSRMMDLPYRKAAPSHDGTIADIIKTLKNL